MTARDRFGFSYATERVVPEVSEVLRKGTAEDAIVDGKRADGRPCDQFRPLCLCSVFFVSLQTIFSFVFPFTAHPFEMTQLYSLEP